MTFLWNRETVKSTLCPALVIIHAEPRGVVALLHIWQGVQSVSYKLSKMKDWSQYSAVAGAPPHLQ